MLIFSYVGEEGSTKCLCKQKKNKSLKNLKLQVIKLGPLNKKNIKKK